MKPLRGFVLDLVLLALVLVGAAALYLLVPHHAQPPAAPPSAASSTPAATATSASVVPAWKSLAVGEQYLDRTNEGFERTATGIERVDFDGVTTTVRGADATTFQVSTAWPVYGRDAAHVYAYEKPIPGADPATFVALCGLPVPLEVSCAYGKDAAHVYVYWQVLPDADPKTFVSLISNNEQNRQNSGKTWIGYGIDANALYDDVSAGADDPSNVRMARYDHLSDGTPLHFTDTAKVIALNYDTARWGGYYEPVKIGTKGYYGGTYLIDGPNVYTYYSACDLDAKGNDVPGSCKTLISRVAKVGDKPAGI